MKIIFLINSPYPRYAGGTENWLYNVSELLSKNHEIEILSQDRKIFPILFTDIPTKIKLHHFKTLRSYKLTKPFIRSYLVLLDLIIGSYTMGLKLKKIIPKNEKCFVIALDSMFSVKAALLAKKSRTDFYLVSSVRSPHPELFSISFKKCSRWLLSLERKMLSRVDDIWANGYDTIDLLAAKGFKSKLIKNGINIKKLENSILKDIKLKSFLNKEISIISVGTLQPIKGIFELIDSVTILNHDYKLDINLIFVGKGNQYQYKAYVKKKNIDNRVFFLGHQSDPIKYVKEGSIAACLSGGSGMSMAAIESMASGTPIIAWDSPVYHQFNREKQTMLLVKKDDVTELVKGILDIINNYDHYLEIAENAKAESQKYDWSVVCDGIIKSLQDH